MSKNVKIDKFEGPFDLLLKLVNNKKLDIGEVSITDIIDQYLAEIAHMQQVDLDIASDFLLVASTLLKIKTDMLLKLEPDEVDEELENMAPSEARDLLIKRLLAYKQFKDASKYLENLEKEHSYMFPRQAGPDSSFLKIMPNYLEKVELIQLTQLAANLFARRDEFLLDAKHIASKPIPVIAYVKTIYSRILNKKNMIFSELIDKSASAKVIVVNFLAILELYKHNFIDIKQAENKNDILLSYNEKSSELKLDDFDTKDIDY